MPPRVYIYCRDDEGNLQEDVITLAEGLRELGVPFFGSCNYWLESMQPGDYLIRHDPDVRPEDCDVVVVSYTWPYWIRMKSFDLVRRPLPERLFANGRRYRTVYMDSHDGYQTVSWEPEFRQFDLILRSKMNRRLWHHSNMQPWVLGLQNRILAATRHSKPWAERERKILLNFGASHPYPHGVRTLAARRFEPEIVKILPIDRTKDDLSIKPTDPLESLMWGQTGGRYSNQYYERLKRAQAVACFCGELIPPLPYHGAERYMVGGGRARIRRKFYEMLACVDPRPWRAVQWDSFRFWEAMAAGCAAINIDLGHYGVEVPEAPQNWTHYIGINFSKVDEAIERMRAGDQLLANIANAGNSWATKHYSPKAMALRFLRLTGLETNAQAR